MLAFCNENRSENTANPKPSASAVTTATASVSPADEAKHIAQVRCAMCHGTSGKGDGPSAATLNPKPRDLSSKDWQKSVSDAQIHSVILQGGVGIGKSPLMPPNPDLADQPQVVDELVKIIRGWGAS
jgi:cytochrome c551/c552